jgi:hypothetical protein
MKKFRWMILAVLAAALTFPSPAAAFSGDAKDMEPGTWTGSGGHRRIRFGKYTWRVLKVAVNKGEKEALLLAEDAVAHMPFNKNGSDGNDWKTSDIKRWLNDEFYQNAFNDSERDAILTTRYRYGGKHEGSDKTDSSRIFLLSADEARNGDFFDDDDDRILRGDGINWGWWLRSPGVYDYSAAGVDYDGEVGGGGYDYIVDREGAVRPALIVSLSSPIFTSSSYKYEIPRDSR